MDKADLIFNRTQADIDLALALRKTNQPLPFNDLKIAADWRMWKRIEEFTKFLADKAKISIIPPVEWGASSTVDRNDEYRILTNINTLRSNVEILVPLSPTPTTIDNMTWGTANDLEYILYEIWNALFTGALLLVSSDNHTLATVDGFILTATRQ